MRKVLVVVSCVLLGVVGQAFSNGKADQGADVTIVVSPQTLLLASDQGGQVTVHTNIPLSQVDRSTVQLNGISAISTGADSRGHLVAKFDEGAVKAIVAPPQATLTLSGCYTDGTSFEASDTVRVIE